MKLESRSMAGYIVHIGAVVPERIAWRVGSLKRGVLREEIVNESSDLLPCSVTKNRWIRPKDAMMNGVQVRIGPLTARDPCLAGPRGW